MEVSREVAAARGIEDGTWVRLTSRRGSAEMIALVTDRVQGNTLFLPIHQGKPARTS
ncbi:molybdopterin dinucleotide binding domain-containing protein [Burkholderia anthina]|uniref:molybdopterin dinucleotide binding domain-containing protein n=1 Tax=Burkholderia anthina TaxID=179879 RepID=UPI0037BFCB00